VLDVAVGLILGLHRVQRARNLVIDLGEHVARFRPVIGWRRSPRTDGLTRSPATLLTNAYGIAPNASGITPVAEGRRRRPHLPGLEAGVLAAQRRSVAERWIGTLRRECLNHLVTVRRPVPGTASEAHPRCSELSPWASHGCRHGTRHGMRCGSGFGGVGWGHTAWGRSQIPRLGPR
jgi:hypothetical protein